MTAKIIPFPGVKFDWPEPEPEPLSFDDARPGWEQEITDLTFTIEHADTMHEWVEACRQLAKLLGALSASVVTD